MILLIIGTIWNNNLIVESLSKRKFSNMGLKTVIYLVSKFVALLVTLFSLFKPITRQVIILSAKALIAPTPQKIEFMLQNKIN